MKWREHILSSPSAGTKPTLRRTGMKVEDIMALLVDGHTVADICANFALSPEEFRACCQYAGELIPNRAQLLSDAGDARLHVSQRQLAKAFRRHLTTARESAEQNDSSLLLLIYAVECGLKKILLTKRGITTTRRLDEDDLTHDLDELLKRVGQPPRFHGVHIEEPDENAASKRIHEALRYGRRLTQRSRRTILATAREVLAWIEENLE